MALRPGKQLPIDIPVASAPARRTVRAHTARSARPIAPRETHTMRSAAIAALLILAVHGAAAFDLQGHRGARGLAPENTIAAFETALAIGVTTFETDLAMTRDGVLVISHDPDLNPALVRVDGAWLGKRGPQIRTLALEELRRYDVGRTDPASAYGKQWPMQKARDGERFPTLAQVFALATASGKPVRFNVETKITPTSGESTPDPETFARAVVEAVRNAGMTKRTTVQSFDWRTLLAIQRIDPDVATSCITSEGGNFDTVKPDATGRSPWHAGIAPSDHGGSLPRMVRAAGCATWSPNQASLTRERVGEAQALGLRVVPWTVNEPADLKRLIDWGVDGLITDYPDRARGVMQENGLPLP
jgi:glycerophosphoryl diester phosphodiesterase